MDKRTGSRNNLTFILHSFLILTVLLIIPCASFSKEDTEELTPNLEMKEKAEQDPLSLASLFVYAIEDKYSKTLTLPYLAEVFYLAGNHKEALKILEESKELTESHQSLRKIVCLLTLAEVYEKIGEKEFALKLISESKPWLPFSSTDNHFLFEVCSKYISIGEYKYAEELLPRFTNLRSKGWIQEKIVDELIRDNLIDRAKKFCESIEDPKSRVSSFIALSKYLIKTGDLQGAQKLINVAGTLAKEIDSSNLKAISFSEIAQTLAKLGKTEESHDLFKQAIKIGENINEDKSTDGASWTLQTIIFKFADSGFLAEAQESAKKISWESLRSETEAGISKLYAQSNDFQKSVSIAESITWPVFKGRAYSYIGVCKAKNGNMEDAEKYFRIALVVTNETEYEGSRDAMVFEIIKRAVQSNLTEIALDLMNEYYVVVNTPRLLIELSTRYLDEKRFFSSKEQYQAHNLISKRFK